LRLHVETLNGGRINWKQASLRFLLACCSWLMLRAGYIWACFDRDRLAFHDRFSGTRLIRAARIQDLG